MAIRYVKKFGSIMIPVILLTAKGQLVDKEKGFISGTDDYIVKPFEPAEVISV